MFTTNALAEINQAALGNLQRLDLVALNVVLKQAALCYAANLGLPVVALFGMELVETGALRCACRRPDCTSRNRGKHPRTSHGFKDATKDAGVIENWWHGGYATNIGVPTGALSGLAVLDIDPEHGGNESLGRLVEKFGPLPKTLKVRTGSGGYHHYFAHPGDGVHIRSVAPIAGYDGLDVRADGGYVVVPPSLHYSGNLYLWEVP